MKNITKIFCCLTVLLLIGGYLSIHVMASSQSQTGDFPDTQQQAAIDIPEDQVTFRAPQANEAFPARLNEAVETFPVSRVQIEVDSAAKLKTLGELGFACSQLGACEVEIDQASLTTLKLYGFNYEILRNGVAVQIDPGINAPNALVNRYGGNDTDYAIPDSTSTTCGFEYSYVNISDAPAGALVQYVEYRARVLHTWPSDLRLYITSQSNKSEIIWDFLGGSDDGGYDDDVENDDDIYLNHRLINTAFDNDPVNQEWYLDAYDCVEGDTGNIDYLELWIWYDDGGAALPNLTAYSPLDWDFPIVPSSVSGTTTVNDLYTAKTTYIDWAVINNGNATVGPAFTSCLFMDQDINSLECWSSDAGLLSDYYVFVKDWEMSPSPSVGWHTLRIEADSNHNVIESNENDNVWSYQFYWNPTQRFIYLPFVTNQQNLYFEGPFELEPNNKYHLANGPIRSGRDYQGYPDDDSDYFSFTSSAAGDITVTLTGHTGTGLQLLLYYNSVDNQVVPADITPPYVITYNGAPGLYYVRIYTAGGYNSTTKYTLRVTYP
jgi:hypothetical protein